MLPELMKWALAASLRKGRKRRMGEKILAVLLPIPRPMNMEKRPFSVRRNKATRVMRKRQSKVTGEFTMVVEELNVCVTPNMNPDAKIRTKKQRQNVVRSAR
jgi:hypothetical protein